MLSTPTNQVTVLCCLFASMTAGGTKEEALCVTGGSGFLLLKLVKLFLSVSSHINIHIDLWLNWFSHPQG